METIINLINSNPMVLVYSLIGIASLITIYLVVRIIKLVAKVGRLTSNNISLGMEKSIVEDKALVLETTNEVLEDELSDMESEISEMEEENESFQTSMVTVPITVYRDIEVKTRMKS